MRGTAIRSRRLRPAFEGDDCGYGWNARCPRDESWGALSGVYGDDLDECGVCGVYGFGARGFLGVRGMLFGFLMPIAFASS